LRQLPCLAAEFFRLVFQGVLFGPAFARFYKPVAFCGQGQLGFGQFRGSRLFAHNLSPLEILFTQLQLCINYWT
jgi:hypothetical protein